MTAQVCPLQMHLWQSIEELDKHEETGNEHRAIDLLEEVGKNHVKDTRISKQDKLETSGSVLTKEEKNEW